MIKQNVWSATFLVETMGFKYKSILFSAGLRVYLIKK